MRSRWGGSGHLAGPWLNDPRARSRRHRLSRPVTAVAAMVMAPAGRIEGKWNSVLSGHDQVKHVTAADDTRAIDQAPLEMLFI